jgi:hypothetical protein
MTMLPTDTPRLIEIAPRESGGYHEMVHKLDPASSPPK